MEKDNRERMKHDMERINTAAAHMQELLNDLLELSRIGRMVNPSEEVSLGERAFGTVRLLSVQIKERGIAVEIAPDIPPVFADRQRIGEVYQNLMENSVKYMGDQKEPRIEIGMREEGNETVYYVRDNGIGVGLAIVKRIIEPHGGSIWVESEGEGMGKGATFCLTLPGKEAGEA